MVKRHLDGIVTAVVDKVTNARAESINAGIGLHSEDEVLSARPLPQPQGDRFRNAIYFHLGGLASLPRRCHPVTHSFHPDS